MDFTKAQIRISDSRKNAVISATNYTFQEINPKYQEVKHFKTLVFNPFKNWKIYAFETVKFDPGKYDPGNNNQYWFSCSCFFVEICQQVLATTLWLIYNLKPYVCLEIILIFV